MLREHLGNKYWGVLLDRSTFRLLHWHNVDVTATSKTGQKLRPILHVTATLSAGLNFLRLSDVTATYNFLPSRAPLQRQKSNGFLPSFWCQGDVEMTSKFGCYVAYLIMTPLPRLKMVKN